MWRNDFPLIGTLFVAAAIVTLFTSDSLTAKPLPATLPPIPEFVVSQIGPAPVIIVPSLACDGVPALGCFRPETHTISLRAGMPLNVMWQTLEHEVFHMIVSDAGIPVPSGMDDAIADAVGSYRVIEMRSSLHLP